MSIRHLASAAALLALTFAGAGCMQFADEAATDVISPVTAPVEALDFAIETVDEAKARERAALLAANGDIAVTFIVTENAVVPTGAEAGRVIGCNDRVAVSRVPRVQVTSNEVVDALTTLFSFRDSNVNGLYNALSQSTFSALKAESKDGVVTEVWLTGEARSGGTCDDPRVKAQIEDTIAQFRPKYKIFLNGTEANWRCLGNMSGKCK